MLSIVNSTQVEKPRKYLELKKTIQGRHILRKYMKVVSRKAELRYQEKKEIKREVILKLSCLFLRFPH